MSRIPSDETPIYTQLMQEYAAREVFQQHFAKNPLPESRSTEEAPETFSGETFSVRGGVLTVFGDPIVARGT